MEEYKNGKIERVLGIYTKLLNGYIVNKAAEANEYGVNNEVYKEMLMYYGRKEMNRAFEVK